MVQFPLHWTENNGSIGNLVTIIIRFSSILCQIRKKTIKCFTNFSIRIYTYEIRMRSTAHAVGKYNWNESNEKKKKKNWRIKKPLIALCTNQQQQVCTSVDGKSVRGFCDKSKSLMYIPHDGAYHWRHCLETMLFLPFWLFSISMRIERAK